MRADDAQVESGEKRNDPKKAASSLIPFKTRSRNLFLAKPQDDSSAKPEIILPVHYHEITQNSEKLKIDVRSELLCMCEVRFLVSEFGPVLLEMLLVALSAKLRLRIRMAAFVGHADLNRKFDGCLSTRVAFRKMEAGVLTCFSEPLLRSG